jgi:septal ring factor EnvC (AmiA/AmiB activator)
VKKTMTLPVAVAVAIIGCVLAVSANVTTSKMHQSLQQERYRRLSAEDQLQKAQITIKNMNEELVTSRAKMEGIEKILNQGRTDSQQLEAQLQGVNQEKQALQQQLQQMQDQLKNLTTLPDAEIQQ